MEKEIVMYSRTWGCPYMRIAKRVLDSHQISYREIFINQVAEAKQRVLGWTGFESVPTMVVAEKGSDLPYQEPAPLAAGKSPRGINRGSMITEASEKQMADWLRQHGFID